MDPALRLSQANNTAQKSDSPAQNQATHLNSGGQGHTSSSETTLTTRKNRARRPIVLAKSVLPSPP